MEAEPKALEDHGGGDPTKETQTGKRVSALPAGMKTKGRKAMRAEALLRLAGHLELSP